MQIYIHIYIGKLDAEWNIYDEIPIDKSIMYAKKKILDNCFFHDSEFVVIILRFQYSIFL